MRHRFAMGLLAVPFAMSAADFRCPPSVLEQPAVQRQEPSWTAVTAASEHVLESAGVFLGDISAPGAQVPDQERQVRRTQQVHWRLPRNPGDQYWIGCNYAGTTTRLLTAIPPEARQCTATYEWPSGANKGRRLQKVVCGEP